ncbi:MAG: P1 family peptidase [Nitriliruptoraceae bacterium]
MSAVDGVTVGTWTSPDAVSGCTVVLPPPGTVGAIAVRGSAPGTREAAALGPAGKVEVCHAVVLAGGSAYGLAAADGVMRWLEERGVGHPVRTGVVPIVGAAIVLDAAVGMPGQRPGPAAGYAACDAARPGDVAEGTIGAGTGCTVAKVGGIEHGWRSGQGVATRRADGVTVWAVVANNALGEVFSADGTPLATSRADVGAPRYPYVDASVIAGGGPAPGENTVIGCVVTDARLDRRAAHRVADLAHTGIARSVRPAHTEFDGDALFCLATGTVETRVDLVAELATDAVAEAVRRGPLTAAAGGGLPALGDRDRHV